MSADVVLSLDYERGVLHNNKLSQNWAQSDTEEDVKLKNIYKKGYRTFTSLRLGM